MILGAEPKNQVIWTIHCKVMAPNLQICPNMGKIDEKRHFLNSNVQWSKSIVLENKVAINFDFRSGAKKSGHLDYPLQSYGPKFVNIIGIF